MRRLSASALTVSTIAFGVSLTSAAPASAAGCKTWSKTYYLSEAKVPMRLGEIIMRIQVCENKKGYITDSRAWTEDSTTAPATLLGWNIKFNGPYQTGKSSVAVAWRATGRAQTCLAGKIPVCSYAENFAMEGSYYGSKFIGPVAGGKGKVHWKPKFTNKYCKLKFNNRK
ncbi:hypothetical protein AB0C51_12840 [Streptomyces pathocidini]|uniref:hypothetical protein n=1 Tax=Streptomyces pathocidini TaxID=1650571 RepID=UPI0033CB091B